MKYWWVNHKKTYSQEVSGGYLWSPKAQKNGQSSHFYDNMTRAQPGDLVFSYANAKIHDVGIIRSEAINAPKPQEFGAAGDDWSADGWLLPVDFIAAPNALRPKDYFGDIKPLLAPKYAPLNREGEGNQGAYLSEISQGLAEYLLENIGGTSLKAQLLSEAKSTSDQIKEENELERLNTDSELPPTEKEQIGKARVGQGQFRRAVSEVESSCRVTGLSELQHLRASHIKPWRDSNNKERLDRNNGLMLAVHIDHLFDKGFITFSGDGELIISRHLSSECKDSFNLSNAQSTGQPFSSAQCAYLEFHREQIFQN
jgi:putative restriction endonuclease